MYMISASRSPWRIHQLPRPRWLPALKLRQLLLLLIGLPVISVLLLGGRQQWVEQLLLRPGTKCVGWRATQACLALGPRDPGGDKSCNTVVDGTSGYCLCEGGVTVARMDCGRHTFRCRDMCASLARNLAAAVVLPVPLTSCPAGEGYDLRRLLPHWDPGAGRPREGAAPPRAGGGPADQTGSGQAAGRAEGWEDEVRREDGGRRLAASAAAGAGGGGGGGAAGRMDPGQAATWVWDVADTLINDHDLEGVRLPGQRIARVDWVMEGKRVAEGDVRRLAEAVAGVLRDAPPYPGEGEGEGEGGGAAAGAGAGGVFHGRGVVMVGGGLRYLVPAWVNLHVLRRTGCSLAAEVWFPVEELPTREVEGALRGLGAAVRPLALRDLGQRGYSVKVAALLLSSFREVLFLDSDNTPLRDPSFLLDHPAYTATGALLWPDYWDPSTAHEVPTVFNISTEAMPRGTFESGQMVIDKARHWRGLLLSAYVNTFPDIFYELLSCYIGKGDKETFAYSMLAAGEPLRLLDSAPPGSAGVQAAVCPPRRGGRACRREFLGNTMVQHDPDGRPLFFHANYHKWDLLLPASFQDWNRRWQVLAPSGRSVQEVVYDNATGVAGYDVERYVYEVLRGFRCAPWFHAYLVARHRMGERLGGGRGLEAALDGFHPLPDYFTTRAFYREGWNGSYVGTVFHPTRWDRWAAWYYGGWKWRIRPWERRLRRWRRRLTGWRRR